MNSPPIVVCTAVADALTTHLVRVEGCFTRGYSGVRIIGNTTEICRDGRERARSALESLGIASPGRSLALSFTPADLKMDGNHLDLAIALVLALVIRGEPAKCIATDRWLFAAELGLDGALKGVKSAVSYAVSAARASLAGIVLAQENASDLEAVLRTGHPTFANLRIETFRSLQEVLAWCDSGAAAQDRTFSSRTSAGERSREIESPSQDRPTFDDMVLDPQTREVALVVAAGGHSLLLRGAPGTGKSMLAARLPAITPPLPSDHHLEAMRIHSMTSERLPAWLLAGLSPFRAPHHHASAAAVLGSGHSPGEIALAHGGYLFLDEFPEFRRDLIEALREPLETGDIRVARSQRRLEWKCQFVLVAACNDCPCGWFGSKRRPCHCAHRKILQYQQRLSGPILDRIDLHYKMAEPSGDDGDYLLVGSDTSGQTEAMREQVLSARHFAASRNRSLGVATNAELRGRPLIDATGLDDARLRSFLTQVLPGATTRRSLIRVLRMARTLADLRQAGTVDLEDLSKAAAWRPKDIDEPIDITWHFETLPRPSCSQRPPSP